MKRILLYLSISLVFFCFKVKAQPGQGFTNNTVAIPVNSVSNYFNNDWLNNRPNAVMPVLLAGNFNSSLQPFSTDPPTIGVGIVSGTIVACLGVASVNPLIQQFTVSGRNLTENINATVTVGFEISLDPNTGFSTSLNLIEKSASVNAIIYVRAAATTTSGNLTGRVILTSSGVTNGASVTGKVNSLPVIGTVLNQQYKNGQLTTGVNFINNNNTITWVNDTPGIGLAASGTGNIAPFIAVNTGGTPIIAHLLATPVSPVTGCTGTPVPFTIEVDSSLPPDISTSGSLSPLSTVYGTPSTSIIFSVSAIRLAAGILVTPPSGFEVSSNDQQFLGMLTVGTAGTLAPSNVYIRLAATTPVGEYSGNIRLTTTNAIDTSLFMPTSTVTPAPLTITADNKSKIYGSVNPPLTASYTGFVNNDTPADLTTQPLISTVAVASSPIGQYPINIGGAVSPNYNITYIPGVLTIVAPPPQVIIPNTFTPNGDGINDLWNIKNIDYYLNCSVCIYNRWGEKVYSSVGYGIPWDGKYKGTNLPVGTYYYILDLKNGFKALSGFVAIIR